jgi:adenylate cyclase
MGRELGAQYVLEGSVRRLGNRLRITAQFIDTRSGNHLWAERYDRDQQDIFTVQDNVVRSIVGTLVGRLNAIGAEQFLRKAPANLMAYDYVLRGIALPVGDISAESRPRSEGLAVRQGLHQLSSYLGPFANRLQIAGN